MSARPRKTPLAAPQPAPADEGLYAQVRAVLEQARQQPTARSTTRWCTPTGMWGA